MDVATWLESLGLGEYAPAFAENRIGPDVLPELTEQDLRDLGVTRMRILATPRRMPSMTGYGLEVTGFEAPPPA